MTSAWRAVQRLRRERTGDPELLDGEDLELDDVRANLRELALLNRLPGGASASIAAVRRLAGRRDAVSILDVGTGGADIPLALVRHGRRHGLEWSVLATDARPDILGIARRRVRSEPAITLQLADGRRLPYPERSFDVAHSSLLLHHLDPGTAVEVLSEMARVARLGVVVNDLQRGPMHFAVTAATVLGLARNRYTRHDGIASARRAYTLAERRDLLATAGLRVLWESSRWAPRVATAAAAARRSTRTAGRS